MVVDRGRERHDERGDARRGELRDRERTRTADHDIGLRVGAGDVVDERLDARRDAGARVGLARGVDAALAGLMAHLEEARRQRRERRGNGGVELGRALAAAHHEQPQRAAACAVADLRRRQRPELGAHRVADGARATGGGEAVREGLEHRVGESREHTVGEARDGVLLVDHERPAQQPGGEPARSGHITAETHHHRRTLAAHRRDRLPQGTQQRERRAQQRHHALAAQTADADPFHRDAGGGHEARLDAGAGAEPYDLAGARTQARGERERREDVPAGAARHDHDPPTAQACAPTANRDPPARSAGPPRRLVAVAPRAATAVSWYTRITMPNHTSAAIMLERP
jgi:hypothetical protein